MKILLFTSYFYPDEHIGARRWDRLTKYLRRSGHEVYVVAHDNRADYQPSNHCDGIKRVDLSTSVPDRILERINKIKRDTNLEIRRQTYTLRRNTGITEFYILTMALLGKIGRFPNIQWWSSNEMVKAGMDIIRITNIDIIIATHPFPGCLKAAHMLSRITNIPWVADMRDGWSSYYDLEYRAGSILHWGITRLEKFYLKSASQVVAVNKKLAATLKVDNDKIQVISNSFDPEEINQPASDNQSNENSVIKFAFAGTILKEHCWDIFLAGLDKCLNLNDDFKVVINYFGNSFDILLTHGRATGIPDDIFINNGYVSKEKLQQELKKADFLIVFGFTGPFGDTVTTGKVFDYIEAGKPILVIGNPKSELAQLVVNTGIGRVISDAHGIIDIIQVYIKNKATFVQSLLMTRREEELNKFSAAETAKVYSDLLASILESVQ